MTLNDPVIAPILPADVQAKLPSNFNVVQRAMDVFSWQEFIALNWPADPRQRGKADPSKPLRLTRADPCGRRGKRSTRCIAPTALLPRRGTSGSLCPKAVPGRKILFRDQKIDDFLDASVQAAAADGTLPATLTDQRGGVVRYEIRMNEVMFDYIVQNRLYDGRVQQGVTRVDWPDGAIILKAAWRPVAETDAPRYLTREACVCEGESKEEKKHCVNMRMGLVGLHVIQKTPSAPQFIWSTYEQVDNLRGTRPSFNDPACTNCPANKQSVPGNPEPGHTRDADPEGRRLQSAEGRARRSRHGQSTSAQRAAFARLVLRSRRNAVAATASWTASRRPCSTRAAAGAREHDDGDVRSAHLDRPLSAVTRWLARLTSARSSPPNSRSR